MKGTRRHRYITFHVVCEGENPLIAHTEFIQALRRLTVELFSKDFKELGLWVVQFDGTQGILKCRYTEKERAIHLLCSLKRIGMKPVTVTTLSTSGTISGLKDKKQNKLLI